MAITIQGTPATAQTTSITLPSHAAGDLLIISDFRSGSSTLPTVPAAGGTVPTWNLITSASSSGNCCIGVYWATAAGTTDTSGTWTNATNLSTIVLRGTASGSAAIGGTGGVANPNSSGLTVPAVTQVDTSGASLLLGFFAKSTTTSTTWSAAPSGYTSQVASGSALTGNAIDSKNSSTSDGSFTQGSGGTVTQAGSIQVEFLVLPAIVVPNLTMAPYTPY